HGAADRGPATRASRATDAVDRAPSGAPRVLLPRRIGGRGRRNPRRAPGYRQVPPLLRAPRPAAGKRHEVPRGGIGLPRIATVRKLIRPMGDLAGAARRPDRPGPSR